MNFPKICAKCGSKLVCIYHCPDCGGMIMGYHWGESPYGRMADACEVCNGPFTNINEKVNPVRWPHGQGSNVWKYVCGPCFRGEKEKLS